MTENADWATWYRGLARTIAKGGEQYLIDKAQLVAWRNNGGESSSEPFRLLQYGDENIDPFSFFYTLASRSTTGKHRKPLYASVAKAFGMSQVPSFDYRFVFPVPTQRNTLFHYRGAGDPRLLWNLFREAVRGVD